MLVYCCTLVSRLFRRNLNDLGFSSATNLGSWSSACPPKHCPYIYLVDKFSGHLVKMGRKYHLNFSCLYHGTIPLFCYGRLGKNKYLHRHWLSKSYAGFVGRNSRGKLKDLYEKSFVSLPLIAIVSPFFFFLFLPVPALQLGVVLPRKKPKRKDAFS